MNCTNRYPPTCTPFLTAGYRYVNTAIGIIGIIGNILIIMVLVRRHFRKSPYTFMLCIAVVDLIICVLTTPTGLLNCWTVSNVGRVVIFVYTRFIYYPIASTCSAGSMWLTVAMSIERLVVIRWPLTARTFSPYVITALLLVVAMALHFPVFFTFYLDTKRMQFRPTNFKLSPGYEVYAWIRSFLTKIIPIIVVAVTNILLLFVIFSAERKHKRSIGSHCEGVFTIATKSSPKLSRTDKCRRGSRHAMRMLISFSVFLFICHSLQSFKLYPIFRAVFGPCSHTTSLYPNLKMLLNILELFSYSGTIFLYTLFSYSFRAILLYVICRRKPSEILD